VRRASRSSGALGDLPLGVGILAADEHVVLARTLPGSTITSQVHRVERLDDARLRESALDLLAERVGVGDEE
jgi:hypothetical protein